MFKVVVMLSLSKLFSLSFVLKQKKQKVKAQDTPLTPLKKGSFTPAGLTLSRLYAPIGMG